MIAEKIRNATAALGVLAGQVPEEAWGLLRCVRAELLDAADSAEVMECGVRLAPETAFETADGGRQE